VGQEFAAVLEVTQLKTIIVVPCYNEAARLDVDAFAPLAEQADNSLLFVDDGSTDGTYAVLRELAKRWPDAVSIYPLSGNQGKGEAVRLGLLAAIDAGAELIGYLDADLSTPAAEMLRLRDIALASKAKVFLGSRVRLLGRRIVRGRIRHYVGRVFATLASAWSLGIPVYDTQCGAKYFKVNDTVKHALASPFKSRWVFDVELLGRLHLGSGSAAPYEVDDFIEVPLREWIDAANSQVKARDGARAALDLLRIGAARHWSS
jgi:glycosyltransferase involved in cell wall biosynthesis